MRKEEKKKEETSVLGDTVNVNQPSAAERALMLSIRAMLCTIVGRQALPNVSILCLLSVAFHKRCSEVGAVFPAKVTKIRSEALCFQISKFEIRKDCTDFVCHKRASACDGWNP